MRRQVLASLRVEQGRPEEALQFLHQSMALWYEQPPDGPEGPVAAAGAAAQEVQEPPSYEFRLETVKLLLELEDTINTAYNVGPPACTVPISGTPAHMRLKLPLHPVDSVRFVCHWHSRCGHVCRVCSLAHPGLSSCPVVEKCCPRWV